MDTHSVIHFSPDSLLHTFLAIEVQTPILLSILGVLLLLSFVISGADVALFSLNNKDINMLKTKQHSAAKKIITLLEEPKEVFASLLLASTFTNICIIIIANFFINEYFELASLPGGLVIFIKVLIISFVILFLCEILPKVWATQSNLRFAYGAVGVVDIIHLLLGRISRWLVSIAMQVGKRMGANKLQASNIRELDDAIDIKSEEEASQEEKNIMKGIVKFGTISVKQIMKSRLDINGIEYSTPLPELLKKIEELHYSRLPVYKDSMDNIVGVLNTKDIIPFLYAADDADWHPVIRTPFFVPESKLIEDLLIDLQNKRLHFAVVVDEFGGTSGIVTMEDIMEEVIGEIRDEFDDEESGPVKVDDNTYIFEGKTMIHDMCKIMKLPIHTFDKVRGESESLAGLVLEVAGAFPEVNEEINVGDFTFVVLETSTNRIKQVKVIIKRSIA